MALYLNIKRFLYFLVLIIIVIPVHAQLPQIKLPQPAIISPSIQIGPSQPVHSFPNQRYLGDPRERNEAIIEEIQRQEEQRILFQKQTMTSLLKENIPLPEYTGAPGANIFQNAFSEISDMLNGNKELNLKKAVFSVEKAYFNGTLNYERFDEEIQNLKRICLLKMTEEGLDINDNLAKIMMIFRIITDEVTVKEPGTENKLTHYPIKYDFEDYRGRQDLSRLFVSKLLSTNTGQCRSMPLLFLILAEEMNAKAYLSFSPEHSFIKFQDKAGKWYNAELTSGGLASDDYYMSSGFIKSQGIKNKIYLSPVNTTETVAHVLSEMGFFYTQKYGYDSFVKQCLDTSLEYFPNNIHTHMIYSNYHTTNAMYVINMLGRPPRNELPQYPQAYGLWKKMLDYYQIVDSLGYEPMPQEAYIQWLKRIEIEKEKPVNQPAPFKQIKY